MKNKLSYAQIFFLTISFTIISFFFVTSLTKAIVGEVMVKVLGMDNDFTQFVLFLVSDDYINTGPTEISQLIIESHGQDKWRKMYPFKKDAFITASFELESEEQREQKGTKLQNSLELYTTKYLWGYENFIALCNRFERFIKWNLESHTEYNAVIHLDDGYLAELKEEREMTDIANALGSLSQYCRRTGCDFLYVQEPYKIGKKWDADISGILDFSNQNADSLIEKLRTSEVTVLDFRELIDEANLSRQQVFYRTDHHWRAEAGFWAANQILHFLNEKFRLKADTEIINESNFTKKEYNDYFLGSQGKKVTLEQTKPDDFILYYPKFDTRLQVFIPDKYINKEGEFTLLYDMDCVSDIDYYNKSPYATYSHGDQPIMQITNKLIKENETKILLIHDSFCDCVIPFLSLGIKRVDALDIRHFTGSVETYIDKEKPDIVIVSYTNSWGTDPINWSNHSDLFDFR